MPEAKDPKNFDFLVEKPTKNYWFTPITIIVTVIAISIAILGFFLHYIIGIMGVLLGLGMIKISLGYNSSITRFSKRSGLTNRH
jgi:hypothetical protein